MLRIKRRPDRPLRDWLRQFASRLLLIPLFAGLALTAQADRVVLLIDNSGSMRTNDVDRLVPAAVTEFIRSLPEHTEVAVVAFDGRGRLIQPLIAADAFDPRILDRLDYRGPWTDLSLAVERGLYELRAPTPGGADHILMITDGIMDTGSPEADLRAEAWLSGELTRQLMARDIALWVVALSEEADFRVLNPITQLSGGDYHRAMTATDVASAMRRIRSAILGLGGPLPVTTDPGAAPPEPVAAEAVPVEPPVVEAPVATRTPALEGSGRWWLATALLALGGGLLGWALWRTWMSRQPLVETTVTPLEYFPDCYLVDLHGVTHQSTHPLKSKYNMITRLQQPPDDGIHYIQIFRRQIGRRHALIEYRDFSFWVIDQQSVNGTFLNGKRVTTETRLKHGDRLHFYKYEFEYCVSDLALSNETLIAEQSTRS